jgi:hypothetical protein
MLDLLCRKSNCGDLEVNLAMRHLANHEWGRARMALERGLAKGLLSEPEQAHLLLQEVRARLGVRGAEKL